MTFAPATIQATRQLKIRYLDTHPGTNAFPADLDPNEVGIVGDTAHAKTGTSYHLGKDQLTDTAYSRRTARDRAGLSNAASAEDVGEFRVTTPKGTFDLKHYTAWLFAQCRASAPDTLDLREVIGTVDGKTVLRWDAERGRSSEPRTGEADSSHLTHTHKSWYRDSEFRDDSKAKLDERYLREIGVIGDDVSVDDVRIGLHGLLKEAAARSTPTGIQVANYLATIINPLLKPLATGADLLPRLDAILAAAQDDGNTTVVLDPASLAVMQDLRAAVSGVAEAVAALPEETADAVLDAESVRLQE